MADYILDEQSLKNFYRLNSTPSLGLKYGSLLRNRRLPNISHSSNPSFFSDEEFDSL